MSKYCVKIVFLLIAISLFNTSNAEDINFSEEGVANEILLGKSLNCKMDELNYHGPEVIRIKKISGKKIAGISNLWCNQKETRCTGQFKRNRMKWQQQDHAAPCYCRSGTLDFFRMDNG